MLAVSTSRWRKTSVPSGRATTASGVHGADLGESRACTYGAEGTRAWDVLRAAKFGEEGGLTADSVTNCVGAVAAGLSDLLEHGYAEAMGPAGGSYVVVVIPSGSRLVESAVARMRAEGWPAPTLTSDVLTEVAGRPRQTGLTSEKRQEAAAGKYAAAGWLVDGKHVVLLDDVCTTGFTIHDAARAIVAAGATSVTGVVYARRIYPEGMALYREEIE